MLTKSIANSSDDDENDKKQGKRGWVSKLASFLPTMARLATNNPVAREVAEDIAEGITGGEGRRAAEEERPAGGENGRKHRGLDPQEEYRRPRPLPPRPSPPSLRQRQEAYHPYDRRRSYDPRRGGPRPPR